jgi:hypothetical protein
MAATSRSVPCHDRPPTTPGSPQASDREPQHGAHRDPGDHEGFLAGPVHALRCAPLLIEDPLRIRARTVPVRVVPCSAGLLELADATRQDLLSPEWYSRFGTRKGFKALPRAVRQTAIDLGPGLNDTPRFVSRRRVGRRQG